MKYFVNLILFSFYFCDVEAVNSRYYPRVHLAPEHGWMNDPNGFIHFKDEYHLYFQLSPKTSLHPGTPHWGHAKSKDLMHWEHQPIAIYPDESYDKDGAFSGSAILINGTIYALYTGNINQPARQRQCLATSKDGIHFKKYTQNPIIEGTDLQPSFRDPNVWKHEGTYYVVIGNSLENQYGRIVLYKSNDLITWNQVSVLAQSNGTLGYMWECPNLFELNGRFVLIFSPQGIKPQGYKYKNLYQLGYFVGTFDYETGTFKAETDFKILDEGHDNYASQTMSDKGKRIILFWADMWNTHYPEQNDGFTGMMSLPRQLILNEDGDLLQKPIKEINNANGKILFSAGSNPGKPIKLPDKAGKVLIQSNANSDLELLVKGKGSSLNSVSLKFISANSTVILDRGSEDGIRLTTWKPKNGSLKWLVFIDASSVELFCGEGEVTFTSRFFPESPVSVQIISGKVNHMEVVELIRTVQLPN